MFHFSYIFSRILVTRQEFNGFSDWWIDLLDNHQVDLQVLTTLQKVTGTITHKVFNTSTLRCSLYESGEQVRTQSLLSCSRTGLLLLGRTLQYIISSLLYSASGQFSWPKLASRRPDMQHSVQRYTSSFLPRNRCLCHNLGDVFQQAVA
jgi:hypothetical protein